MSFFQNVYQELVERRLLPLAVLLVLALVAVPLTLSKSMPNTPPTAASGATPELDIPSAVPAVSLTSPDRGGRLDHLNALNPFEQRHKPHVKVLKTVATQSAAATPAAASHPAPASSSPIASSSGASVGSASASASTPPSSASASAPASSPVQVPHAPAKRAPTPRYLVASLQVRFGSIGHTGNRRGIDRLSPLPSRGTPAVIYLGLLRDRKTAVFLLSSDVHAEGDGRCEPSPRSCKTVRVQVGQSEFFDQTDSRGGVTQYRLDIVRVAPRMVASARTARQINARVSRRGQRIERHSGAFKAHFSVSRVLRYDDRAGVLVARPRR